MPGDYKFPPRVFREGEPLDPDELNQALQPAAEALNGLLGPHNLRAPLPSDVVSDLDVFTRMVAVHVDVASGMSHRVRSPSASPFDAFVLEQETAWQMIAAESADKDMRISLATGRANLEMMGTATYCFHGFDDGVRETWTVEVPDFFDSVYPDYYDSDNTRDVKVYLDSPTTGGYFHTIGLLLPDPETHSMQKIREDIAQQIARGGVFEVSYASSTWGGAGYTARAEGTNVIFTKMSASATVGDIKIDYFSGQVRYGDLEYEFAAASQTLRLSDLKSRDTDGSNHALVYFAAQVQFALRVDGVVLENTITGRYDTEQAAFVPGKIRNPKTNDIATAVGPFWARVTNRPNSLGLPMYTIRLNYAVEVEPGDHIIELVMRRSPGGPRDGFQFRAPDIGIVPDPPRVMPADSRITVFARQLSVIELPVEASTAAAFGEPTTVPAWSPEDVVSNASLRGARFDVIHEKMNALLDYNLARGAVNNDHLENLSTVLAVAHQDGVTGTRKLQEILNHTYGYAVGSRVFGSDHRFVEASTLPGWQLITAAELSETLERNQKCALMVEGNVFLDKLGTTLVHKASIGTDSTLSDQRHLLAAVFCVALHEKASGKWYLWMPSIAWSNSNNYWASQPTATATPAETPLAVNYLSAYGNNHGLDFVDIPVTAHFVMKGLVGLARAIDKVAIFGCLCNMTTKVMVNEARVASVTLNAIATKL